MKRKIAVSGKKLDNVIASPGTKRRPDLDYLDFVEMYELPDGRLVVKDTGTNRGFYFETMDDYHEFAAMVKQIPDGKSVAILQGYATATSTFEILTEDAVVFLSELLKLDKRIFTATESSFTQIDPALKTYMREYRRRDCDYKLIQATISYLSATVVKDKGAKWALKYNQAENTYWPILELSGHDFNFVTNVSDDYFEKPHNFSLAFCYSSQPMGL